MCDPFTAAVVGTAGTAAGSAGAVTAGTAAAASTGISAATAIGATATAASIGFGLEAMQRGKDAAKLQQAQIAEQNKRSQIQALREAQIKRAMMVQQGASSGALDSSGFRGGVSSLGSQLGGNIQFSNTIGQLSQQQAAAQQGANQAQGFSNLAGTLGNFAFSSQGNQLFNG